MPNFSGVWNLKEQIQAIAAGRWTGVPLYELYAWGSNGVGQLGDNTVIDKSSPVQVGSSTTWTQVSAGGSNSGAVKTDGTLWMWGDNSPNGQIGDSTIVDRSSPVQIGALTNWAQVSVGPLHVGAVKTDGTLWMWGDNGGGKLGDNTVIDKSSPVQIGALTNWSYILAGSQSSLALKTNGTMWAWGSANFGQLGTNNLIARSSPVQIGALTTWDKLGAAGNTRFAIKTDGTLWGWGQNSSGSLGTGNTYVRSSPVQIGALTDWAQVSNGTGAATLAVKTDGTLWSWGRNTEGQLGTGDVTFRSSPVQVGALTTWSSVDSGDGHVAAIKIDGTLWAWGHNTSGELGDGTAISRSSPVQVGLETSWFQAAGGSNHTTAILQGATN